ncbi:MAG: CRTAC1 family protein [Planctomycetota bacterium]
MRWSALAVLLLVGCSDENIDKSQMEVVRRGVELRAASLAAQFVDATNAAHVSFVHRNGMTPRKLLPETLGSGVGLFDYDGDGIIDIWFVNGRSWTREGPATPSALYRGLGGGRFRDVSSEVGLTFERYGMGCCMADVDADGDEDVFVTAVDGNVFLRNEEGRRFVDATLEAGLASRTWTTADLGPVPEWGTAAAWFDADGDGDLDLFVSNYCRWTPELEIFTTLDGVEKVFSTPDRYDGLPCRLFLNDGHGRFAEGPGREELERHLGKALGVALWDFDDDGLLDVVVANDTRPNFLFMNRGGGHFDEVGFQAGIAYDTHGRARAGMGVDVAHLRSVGGPVVSIGNFAQEPLSFFAWRQESRGSLPAFQDVARSWGLEGAAFAPLTFGLCYADCDLDGWQDLVVVNGHIEPDIARYVRGESYAQPILYFAGGADGFVDVSDRSGAALAEPRVARGLAHGDLDGDGDIDLVVTTNGGPALVLRNDLASSVGGRHLRIRLRGERGNPRAIGARVTLDWAGHRQVRTVRTGSSYVSQSELTLTFGLGTREGSGTVSVRWPRAGSTTHAFTHETRELTLEAP